MKTVPNRTDCTALALTHPWQPAFLRALRMAGCVAHACKTARRQKSWVYEVRRNSPEFAAAWDDAIEEFADDLQAEAVERAVDGFREPILHQGQLIYVSMLADGRIVPDGTEGSKLCILTKRRVSDAVLLRMLEAVRPKMFRSQSNVTVVGDPSKPVTHHHTAGMADYRSMSDDELRARIAELRSRAAASGADGAGGPDGGGTDDRGRTGPA